MTDNKINKIIYMGTPDFAVPGLKELLKAGYNVSLVVTQPDKPKGRNKKMAYPPVKEVALEAGIEVLQPEKASDESFLKRLEDEAPDLIIVTAYGKILKERLLNIPKYGCINVHASLLPKYRGAAPIQWSIIMGDKETGITTMQMDAGLDTGDILLKESIPIGKEDTGDSLSEKLSILGGKVLIDTIKLLENGRLKGTPQKGDPGMYAAMLKKEDGFIDFNDDAEAIERKIRGLYSWPCAYTFLKGKMIRLAGSHVEESEDKDIAPGTVAYVTKKKIIVKCKRGMIAIDKVQPEGKKVMDTAAFLAGNMIEAGDIFQQEDKI